MIVGYALTEATIDDAEYHLTSLYSNRRRAPFLDLEQPSRTNTLSSYLTYCYLH